MGDNAAPVIVSDNWCRTTNGEKASTTFTWTIEDFFDRPEKNDEFIKSSTFSINGPNDKVTSWELKLYPKGDRGQSEFVSLYIMNKSFSSEKVMASASLLDVRGKKVRTHNMTELFKVCVL